MQTQRVHYAICTVKNAHNYASIEMCHKYHRAVKSALLELLELLLELIALSMFSYIHTSF